MEKTYKFRLFYMNPPIMQTKKPDTMEFELTEELKTVFGSAYNAARKWVNENHPKAIILMLAQLNR